MSRHMDPAWQREVMDDAARRFFEITRDATQGGGVDQKVIDVALTEVMGRYGVAEEQTVAMFLWSVVAMTCSAKLMNKQAIDSGSSSFYDFFVNHEFDEIQRRFGQ